MVVEVMVTFSFIIKDYIYGEEKEIINIYKREYGENGIWVSS